MGNGQGKKNRVFRTAIIKGKQEPTKRNEKKQRAKNRRDNFCLYFLHFFRIFIKRWCGRSKQQKKTGGKQKKGITYTEKMGSFSFWVEHGEKRLFFATFDQLPLEDGHIVTTAGN